MAQNMALMNGAGGGKLVGRASPPASAVAKALSSSSTTMDVIRDCSPTRPKLTKVSERQPKLLLDQINQLRRATELCDVVLVVGTSRIQAHKIILSASSPYFRAMFTGEMAESKQTEIIIKDIDETAMEMLIDFCYTSKITVDEKIVQTLLPAACLLQLQEVQEYCSEFLRSQLDPSNCLGIRAFADTHSCRELLVLADKFMRNNFPEVMESEEFLLLPVGQLIEIISNDELNVRNEEQVYQAVMNWIRYGLDERKQYLAELLMHVRLPLVDTKFLVKFICSEPLLRQDPTCRDLLDEAKDYHLLPQERALMQGPRTKPRKPLAQTVHELVFAVGGWCSGDAISSVEMFDPHVASSSGEWRLVTPMSKRRCGVGVAVLNQQIYAIGGHDGTSYLNSVERYDPIVNQWFMDVSPTTSCRTSVGVAVLDNYLYAIGGQDGVSCLNYVEKYDSRVNRWTRVASMRTRRLGVAVAVLGNFLYAIGGSDGTSPLNTVERYDPKVNKWELVASMSTPRKHLGCAVYKNHIYAVGGRDDAAELNSVERYNPQTNEWSPVVGMKSRRSGVGLAVVNGLLMAIGGFDGSNYLKTIETYDSELDSWKLSGSMIYRRLGGGVGVIKLENRNSALFRTANTGDAAAAVATATTATSSATISLVPGRSPSSSNAANYQPPILSPTPLLSSNLGAYSHQASYVGGGSGAGYGDANLPSLIANVPPNALISSISSTTPTTPTGSLLSSASSSNLVGSLLVDPSSSPELYHSQSSSVVIGASSASGSGGATGNSSSPTASATGISNMKLLDL